MKITTLIVENGKVKNFFDFALEHGKHKGEKYKALLYMSCANPICTCNELFIEIFHVMEDGGEENEKIFQFGIDIKNKKLSKNLNSGRSNHDLNFAKDFINEATDNEWSVFQNYFYSVKYKLTEECDMETLDASFPESEIELSSTMIPFSEIIPYGRQFRITYNDTEYFVDDQYCLNSKCRCTEAMLTFVELAGDAIKKERKPFTVLFDYEKNSSEIYEQSLYTLEDVHSAFDKLKKENGNLVYLFKKRHSTLRKLYRNYRKKTVSM